MGQETAFERSLSMKLRRSVLTQHHGVKFIFQSYKVD